MNKGRGRLLLNGLALLGVGSILQPKLGGLLEPALGKTVAFVASLLLLLLVVMAIADALWYLLERRRQQILSSVRKKFMGQMNEGRDLVNVYANELRRETEYNAEAREVLQKGCEALRADLTPVGLFIRDAELPRQAKRYPELNRVYILRTAMIHAFHRLNELMSDKGFKDREAIMRAREILRDLKEVHGRDLETAVHELC